MKEYVEEDPEKLLNEFIKDQDINLNNKIELTESWFEKQNNAGEWNLSPGSYILIENIADPLTGEAICKKGTAVYSDGFAEAQGTMLGLNVYKVKHIPTNRNIYITSHDIER